MNNFTPAGTLAVAHKLIRNANNCSLDVKIIHSNGRDATWLTITKKQATVLVDLGMNLYTHTDPSMSGRVFLFNNT